MSEGVHEMNRTRPGVRELEERRRVATHAEAHEESARLHERAAQLATELGHADKAARYRETAAKARKAARQASRLAEEDQGRLAGDRAIRG
jgi:hypothetical protein